MKTNRKNYPLIKLPLDVQESLLLIKEELKCRRLFQALHEAGIDDCYFQPHLDALILQHTGLNDGTDETYSVYDTILEKRSRKIEADTDSIMKQALKVYYELLNEKRKLVKKRSAN